jgi:hypothetical protein
VGERSGHHDFWWIFAVIKGPGGLRYLFNDNLLEHSYGEGWGWVDVNGKVKKIEGGANSGVAPRTQ